MKPKDAHNFNFDSQPLDAVSDDIADVGVGVVTLG